MRLDAGLTQAELAKRLQKDQTWVSKVELGTYTVSVDDFLAVAAITGHEVDLQPIKRADHRERLARLVSSLQPAQVERAIELIALLPLIPERLLRGLLVFAKSQAQPEDAAG